MIYKALVEKVGNHLSSFTLTSILIILAILSEHKYTALFIPEGMRLIVAFMLIFMLVLFEIGSAKDKQLSVRDDELHARDVKISEKLESILKILEVTTLKAEVSKVYADFKSSGDEKITGSLAIEKISHLEDERKRLGINSSDTQGALSYLIDKIHR